MIIVDVHRAKTHLSHLLKRALAGEDVMIAKAGQPVVRLVPVREAFARHPGLAKGRVTPLSKDELPD